MAEKDFSLIESDYAFFMAHATEAERDVAEYARELVGFVRGRTSIRLLDFGCGTGEFTQELVSTLNWPPEALRVTLVEPVRHQREEAARRLEKFSHHPIESLERLPADRGATFDLVLSNHVLYYVDDLNQTLRQMTDLLRPGGKLLLAIANWDNVLIQLWKIGFAMLARPVPYYTAEDVERFLSEHGVPFRQSATSYQLRFPDSQENRWKILRFLFGEYLDEMSAERLLGEFDRYLRGTDIDLNTVSDHFVVEVVSQSVE